MFIVAFKKINENGGCNVEKKTQRRLYKEDIVMAIPILQLPQPPPLLSYHTVKIKDEHKIKVKSKKKRDSISKLSVFVRIILARNGKLCIYVGSLTWLMLWHIFKIFLA